MSLQGKDGGKTALPGAEPELPTGMNRRDFMRVGGTLAAATAITTSACQPPAETSVPFNERPEGLRSLGKPKFYATVLDGAPVKVRTREGRPIGILPHGEEPSGRGLSVRTHASLLDLYDPDRAQGPLSLRRGKGARIKTGWNAVGTQVVKNLKARQGQTVLLTRPLSGPAELAVIKALGDQFGLRHVSYDPLANDTAARAYKAVVSEDKLPRPRLDQAALVVGFGAEFIDRPEDGLERDFATRRDPDAAQGMSRFIQFEGRLTLTGANADKRVRVRDSHLPLLASALAKAMVVDQKVGPLAGNAELAAALAKHDLATAANETGVPLDFLKGLITELLAARGKVILLAGGSASAGAGGLALETAVAVLNQSLGAYDSPAFDKKMEGPRLSPPITDLVSLVADMKGNKVATLLIAGPNPVYDAPAGVDFSGAMANVKHIVSLNDRVDETSALADYLAPASHALEAWGDAALGADLYGVQQPVIRPLYNTHGLFDVLISWAAAAGARGSLAEAADQTRPAAKDGAPPELSSAAYYFVKTHWIRNILPGAGAWEDALRQGWYKKAAPAPAPVAAPAPATEGSDDAVIAAGAAPGARLAHADSGEGAGLSLAAVLHRTGLTPEAITLLKLPASTPGDLELQLYPHFALEDGRAGNNGWLLEFLDPITRLTWGGALSMAPRRFDEMKLKDGDLLEVAAGGKSLTLPAYRHAGMHQDQVAIPLGLGRTMAGEIGNEVGVNAFGMQQLVNGHVLRSGLAVTLKKTGKHQELADGQGADVIDRKPRPIVPTATLEAYNKDPRAGTEQVPGGPSAWPDHEYKGQRWGMAIDLSKCNGCGKCTLSCQAENNIPIVGRQGIIDGREMSWIRIDRYYDAPAREGGWDDKVWDGPLEVVEDPTTLFEPMMCQHCENAPCETVCPFNATMHSADGVNQQIYNRCVGTRYCANNCPFKVRRYNWFEYSHPQDSWFFTKVVPKLKRHAELNTRGAMQMKNNPEVTVRSRGVMEKCSFCVQRIREARAEAIRDGQPTERFDDGSVVPACMEVCPTGAIVFGDLNDPTSRVHALAENPRAMKLLEQVGIKPSISYLTKVRNDKA